MATRQPRSDRQPITAAAMYPYARPELVAEARRRDLEWRDELIQEIKSRKLESNVLFFGYLSENDKITVYKSSDIFVFEE